MPQAILTPTQPHQVPRPSVGGSRDRGLRNLVAKFLDNIATDGPVNSFHKTRRAIGRTPAQTDAGIRAKAEAVLAGIENKCDASHPDKDEHLAWSLCQDILAR